MRLPILILVHIATAHRVDLDLTATTGEGSNTSSIAATVLQNSTAVVGTHGIDRGVLSRAGPEIPGKLMQRLALILAASSVLGGPLPAVAAKAMPTAFVAPGVRRNALSGSGFLPSAMEAAGPGSGIPDPSGQIFQEAAYKSYRKGLADCVLTNNVEADPVPLTMVEKAYVLLNLLEEGRRLLIEERRDAGFAAEGMTKELEAEYKSHREALDDFLLNTVDAVPRTIIQDAYVFLKLLREERRSLNA